MRAPELQRDFLPQRGFIAQHVARRQRLAGLERVLGQGALAESVDGVDWRQVHLFGGAAQAREQGWQSFAGQRVGQQALGQHHARVVAVGGLQRACRLR